MDRIDLQRLSQAAQSRVPRRRPLPHRGADRASTPAAQVLVELHHGPDLQATAERCARRCPRPAGDAGRRATLLARQPEHGRHAAAAPLAGHADVWVVRSGTALSSACDLPDGQWLNVTAPIEPPRPWHSPTFLAAFLLMTVVAAGLTLWAVRRLTAPVRTLAAAAEALGRDVNAPPLPGGRAAGGRHRRRRLQHHGGAHPPLRAGPHRAADRDRPRPAHADHPAEAARRVHRGRRAAAEGAGGPGGAGDDGLRHAGVRPRCADQRAGGGARSGRVAAHHPGRDGRRPAGGGDRVDL